jgi:putative nucleotidyltransferase with HDIG domain
MEMRDPRATGARFYNRGVAVPSRVESAALILELQPPRWFIAHSAAVAEIAAFLAARASRRTRCNRQVVESAALLHDVDKLVPGLPGDHGRAGARWLRRRGFGELAPAVAAHPVRRLADDHWYDDWSKRATLEERIVSYADKRAGQRLESLAARFAGWAERYPEYRSSLSRARKRADGLEREVCRAAGVRPDGVRRLRWVGHAIGNASAIRDARGATQ